MDADDIRAALAEPFDQREVKWKPQSVKGNRALAICYIDARLVMDRLDEVVGLGGWKSEYTQVGPNSVECRLSVRLDGEWVVKADVGSISEQPDEGDRMKAAYSDALKRAAVQWGIGRYLYRLGHQWLDYDPHKKQFTQAPKLPPWAVPQKQPSREPYPDPPAHEPAAKSATPPRKKAPPPATVRELWDRMHTLTGPKSGAELLAWVGSADAALVGLLAGDYTPGGVCDSVVRFLKKKTPAEVEAVKLAADLEAGWNHAKQYVKGLETPAKVGGA